MLRTLVGNARIFSMGEVKLGKRTNYEGVEVDTKSLLFKIVTHRNYSVPKKDAGGNFIMKDGQVVKERPADFILCKVTDRLVDVIVNNMEYELDATNNTKKLVSRRVELTGHIETYTTSKKVKIKKNVSFNGAIGEVEFDADVPYDAFIFVVDSVDFLDPKQTSPLAVAPAPTGTAPTDVVQMKVVTPGANTNATLTPGANIAPAPVVTGDTVILNGEGQPIDPDDCPF